MTLNLSLEDLAKRYSRYYIYIEPVVSDPLIRGYFSLVASFLAIAFFMVFALSPTINTILALQKKITEQKQVVAALNQKITNLVTAQANYSQVESSLPNLMTALPLTPTAQTIISGVMTSASASGITLTSLEFKNLPLSSDSVDQVVQAQKPGEVLLVNFTLTTTNTPDKIHSFLFAIENLPRQIHLLNLDLSQTPDSPTMTSVSVKANGYYLSEGNL